MTIGLMNRLTSALRRLEAILSTAVKAIVTNDNSGAMESVNCVTTTLFGYSADELNGRNVKLLIRDVLDQLSPQ
jgi:PAS domain S-box-containing protein